MASAKDLTGLRFGKLTVIERAHGSPDRYALWLCRCDCGGQVLASSRQLRQGSVRSCGCVPKPTMRRGPVVEDLTGRRFGRLTVLERAPNTGSRTCWLCRCDCGRQTTVNAHDLKAGRILSCGCMQHQSGRWYTDLAGQRFGRLVALTPTRERDAKGSIIWQCQCDCGNHVHASSDALLHGSIKSCGCLKRELELDLCNQLHRVDGTCVEHLEKRKHRSDNTSGFRGVYPTASGKYRVCIGFKGKHYTVGTYPDFDTAVAARLEVEEQIHGGFVRAWRAWQILADQDPSWAQAHPFSFDVEKTSAGFIVSD